mmetsp:Transcript_57267/g.166152  ORF Transcript_57267/g.166152 Transcript_57267/m.166152 type:complete len:286 (+) Transcript_57267:326-1183(+)
MMDTEPAAEADACGRGEGALPPSTIAFGFAQASSMGWTHKGQRLLRCNHRSTQRRWKSWPQGNFLMETPSTYSVKQIEQAAPGSLQVLWLKRSTGNAAIMSGVAAATFGAASPSSPVPRWSNNSRKMTSAATARAADNTITEAVSLQMPGQFGQDSVCIHQTMPNTNHPYCISATVLLKRQAGEAVSDVMHASTLSPVLSARRTLIKRTTRTGIWLICRRAWNKSHHLSGRSHWSHRDQYRPKKIPHARPTTALPTALNNATKRISCVAAAGSRRTTSTKWSSLC